MTNTHLTSDDLLLTDGGLETVLCFHDGIDLPAFAAFPLLESGDGRGRLARYSRDFMRVAEEAGAGYVHETPTWRANRDWGAELGYTPEQLTRIVHDSVAVGHKLRAKWNGKGSFLVSGCIGPRGDGYVPGKTMTADEAAEYHRAQVRDFADAGADLVTAMTLSYVDEATGIVAAAAEVGIPVVIGFTVETDGRLPSGTTLEDAIVGVDASTGSYASWFLVNCAHPDHVAPALTGKWTARIGALRANASRLSHAELDEATELDDGNPVELAEDYRTLAASLPGLRVLGGCCGTDVRHVKAIADAWTATR